MKIKVGCCGWTYFNPNKALNLSNWKERYKHKIQAYASLFELVEVNSTFYKIPRRSTVENWRSLVDEINPSFEFTVKSSRVITHEDLFSGEASLQAYYKIKEIAEALRARIILFQTPASFRNTPENINKLRTFFSKIKRDDLVMVWEPRGSSWLNSPDTILEVCSELDLCHCVDPFKAFPRAFSSHEVGYMRLHGKPPGKEMYKYKYKDEDLERLLNFVNRICEAKEIYVLFNNIYMYEDATRFIGYLKSTTQETSNQVR